MTYETQAGIIFFLFTGLLLVGSITTFARVVDLLRRRQSLPTLLIRDVICWAGLAWPFVAIGFVRTFDLGPVIMGQVWWLWFTGLPPIVAAATYVYFELAVIGRRA